jgi:hypothetical protein
MQAFLRIRALSQSQQCFSVSCFGLAIVLTEITADQHVVFNSLRIPSGCSLHSLDSHWLRVSSAVSIFRLICQNNLTLITCKIINYIRGFWCSAKSKTFRKRTLFRFLHENQSAWAGRRERMHDKMYKLSYIWMFLGHCPLSGFQIILIFSQDATTPSGPRLPP